MKKVVYILFISLIISFISFLSFADSNSYGTNVEFVANGEEEYTVTVPAQMSLNGIGDVSVNGMWASNRVINVSSDDSVELTSNINFLSKKKIDVNFKGIIENGNDNSVKLLNQRILLGEFETDPLFGEWTGNFNYNVGIYDAPLYYNKTYIKTFEADEVPMMMPYQVVVYLDNSALFIHDDGYVFKTNPNEVVFENNTATYDILSFVVSDDKTKFTAYDTTTNEILCIWELDKTATVYDDTLPITFKMSDVANNASFVINDLTYVKVSDIFLSKKELENLKIVLKDSNDTMTITPYLQTCDITENDGFCFLAINDDYIAFSVNGPLAYDGMIIKEKGFYFPLLSSESDGVVELIVEENDSNEIEWNTMEVRNNTRVTYNDEEYVKVYDTFSEDFFPSYMNYVADGTIVPYDFRSGVGSEIGRKFFSLSSSNLTNKTIILVKTPGMLDDTYFPEPGIYAFNYGKYNKNYTISFSDRNYPIYKNPVKFDNKYSYKNTFIQFNDDNTVNFNGKNMSFVFYGRTVVIDDNYVGVVSKDGNKIKFYKYLSFKWIDGVDDDVIFTYEG